MAAQKPSIPSSKTPALATELSDIPLSLEQTSNDINAAQTHKAKSNSLKRFFRKTKSQESQDAVGMPKEAVSLQLRFGTFHKNDGVQKTANDMAAGSSKSIGSESRLNLPERLSNYWNNVFKKTPKKIPTAISDQGDVGTPAVVSPIEDNPHDI